MDEGVEGEEDDGYDAEREGGRVAWKVSTATWGTTKIHWGRGERERHP